MNRNLGIWVLVLLLTATGIIAMLTHERNAVAARLAKAEAAQHKLAADLEASRSERDKLRRQLQMQSQAAAELALAATSRKPSPAPAPPSTPASSAGGKSAGAPDASAKSRNPLAEMMKNPAMKDMMRQQQIAALDTQYSGLFSRFQFTDEEKTDFKKLLSDHLQHEAEIGFKMFEDMTPEQRKALVQEYENSKKDSDARIRDFLNSDADYNTFKTWEETKGERMQLEMGRSLFTNTGDPLTPEQEEQLISVMQQVRKQPSTVPDLSKPQNFDPARLTQADIDQQLAHFDANATAIANQAAQFLSAKQLESLRTMQQQWRTMNEAGLKMTSAMYGSQTQPAGK